MQNQQLMVQEKLRFWLLVVFLLCVSAARSFDYEDGAEELLLGRLFDPVTEEVDQSVASLLWDSCKLDLISLKEGDEDLNFLIPEETSSRRAELNFKARSLSKPNMQFLRAPHPRWRQTLLDCIRRNGLVFSISGEERGSTMQYLKHLNFLLFSSSVPARKLRESIAEPPTSAPSPAPSPQSVSTTGGKPTPREVHAATSSSGESESPKTAGEPGGNSQRKKIIIAVVATAAMTSILAALFFFCCSKVFRSRSGAGLNDEKPLLSLGLSDSVSSSHKFYSSFKEDKLGSQSPSHHRKNSSIDGKIFSDNFAFASMDGIRGATKSAPELVDTSMAGNSLLPPPPGRTSGLPPLKPPPGRAVPLPPEPPAPHRPPPSKAAPPPTTPPPPTMKPSVSAATLPLGHPPLPPPAIPGPRPPAPPPSGGPGPPRAPPPMASKVPKAPGARDSEGGDSKAKLKPFFWDKVLANPDQSMVWHQIKSGSFQFNEEMIETLFGYTVPEKSKVKKNVSQEPSSQFIQILDRRKAQNLSILLRALNVTIEEVSDALLQGNELPAEFLQTLMKMAPTSDEELKLRLFSGELSQLGPAERFLKALVDIPFAFHRMEALYLMGTLEEEIASVMESFQTLEVASNELRNSRLFLKLLEAVLKTGNRMNDGTFRGGAQAFKLDTLLKLSDVKGVDGKTTLLHFVVQEIVRSEGVRAAHARRESISVKTDTETEDYYCALGLQVVSRLSSELENVKKAAAIDADALMRTVSRLDHSQLQTRDFLNKKMKGLEDSGFHQVLKSFVQSSEGEVTSLLQEEKRIMALVKSTGDYFHGNSGSDEGLRLFTVVRDFLVMLEKVCKEVEAAQKKSAKAVRKETCTASSNSNSSITQVQPPPPRPDPRSKLIPAIAERRPQSSESSDESE